MKAQPKPLEESDIRPKFNKGVMTKWTYVVMGLLCAGTWGGPMAIAQYPNTNYPNVISQEPSQSDDFFFLKAGQKEALLLNQNRKPKWTFKIAEGVFTEGSWFLKNGDTFYITVYINTVTYIKTATGDRATVPLQTQVLYTLNVADGKMKWSYGIPQVGHLNAINALFVHDKNNHHFIY
jgi:hypothetical protein